MSFAPWGSCADIQQLMATQFCPCYGVESPDYEKCLATASQLNNGCLTGNSGACAQFYDEMVQACQSCGEGACPDDALWSITNALSGCPLRRGIEGFRKQSISAPVAVWGIGLGVIFGLIFLALMRRR